MVQLVVAPFWASILVVLVSLLIGFVERGTHITIRTYIESSMIDKTIYSNYTYRFRITEYKTY